MADSGSGSCEFALMFAPSLSLLRRNSKSDDVAWIDRHFLTHWGPVPSHRISKEPNASGTTNQVPGDGEGMGRVAGGEPQADSLAAIDGVDYHITETLIPDLHRCRVRRLRRCFARAAGAGSRGCKHHDERGMDEEGHGRSR